MSIDQLNSRVDLQLLFMLIDYLLPQKHYSDREKIML
jgi:hypothetical protein